MTSFPVADPQEVELAPGTAAPLQAREFVDRYLTQHDLAYLRDDVCRVVSELVSNAVVGGQSLIRVRIEEMPFCLRLTVYDDSVSSPMLRLATRLGSGSESGRGAWIVDACTDDWGIDVLGDEDKCTWALFAVRPKSSLVQDI